MKKKILSFIFAACLLVSGACVLTACNDDPNNVGTGGTGTGICKNNSCEFTECFTADEFASESFYAKTGSLGFSKMGNYDYDVWAEMNFGHIKEPRSYQESEKEPVAYQPYHVELCVKCGNLREEKHTFVHTKILDGFNHNIRCTDCGYTHEAYCCFEDGGMIDHYEANCFCGNQKPNFDISNGESGIRVVLKPSTTGDVVIPNKIDGKMVTAVQLSTSNDYQNQQIKSLTIPYTAMENFNVQPNNYIEKIVISGLTQTEYQEWSTKYQAKIQELEQKFQSGEIDNYQMTEQLNELRKEIQPHDIYDMRMSISNLPQLKEISVKADQFVVLNEIKVQNCSNLETINASNVNTVKIEGCTGVKTFVGGALNCMDTDDALKPQNLVEVTLTNPNAYDNRLPKSVKTITLGERFTEIQGYNFSNNANIETINGAEVTTVLQSAFENCSNLKTVNFPKLNNVAASAFKNCSKLETIDLSKVTIFDSYAFQGCTKLNNITLSNQLESIPYYLFDGCEALTEITIPAGVTTINEYAFNNCIKLAKIYFNAVHMEEGCSNVFVNVADSVTDGAELVIGKDVEIIPYGFTNGSYSYNEELNITKVTFESESKLKVIASTAFTSLKIKTITLPESLEEVQEQAFTNCGELETINFGTLDLSSKILNNCIKYKYEEYNNGYYFGKEFVGAKAGTVNLVIKDGTTRGVQTDNIRFIYDAKTTLESVVMPNSIVEWNGSFEGCERLNLVTLSSNLKTISEGMFAYCYNLESITIPNGVTKIEERAFYYCPNLSTVNIPNGVTEIGNDAFYGCGLTTVEIPASVKTIGGNAFHGNVITSLTLNEGLVNIGAMAFKNIQVAKIILPSTVRSICDSAFSGVGVWNEQDEFYEFELVLNEGLEILEERALKETYISTLTEIGIGAFQDCDCLTEVTLPSLITTLNSQIFYQCDNLTTINLPSELKTIRANAFQNMPKLESITIPASVETIENYSFYNCATLQEIKLLGSVQLPDLAVVACPLYKGQLYKGAYYNGTILTALEDNTVPFVYIKEGTTEVKQGVFTGLTTLRGVFIPESLTTIQANEFAGCTNVTLAFGGNLTQNISKVAYWGATKYVNMLANATEDGWVYTTPDNSGLSQIAGYYGSETVITIPTGLGGSTMVSVSGFEGNTNITKVIMGNNVVAISENAFKNCTALQEVTISSNVYLIGANAFIGCTNLTTVNVSGGDFDIYDVTATPMVDAPVATVKVTDADFVTKLTSTYANKMWFRMPVA